ncbi:MAG: citrate/2-methylcitrate synthase [Planctomycetota bacterium]|nr:citrate/2-methylcitrate synthase [Planctomycetota bacterium]
MSEQTKNVALADGTTCRIAPSFDKGLMHTIAAESPMSFIDGEKGVLEYVGLNIDDLARNSTFEECVYLLWHKRLPTASELEIFQERIRDEYDLPDPMWEMIRQIPKYATPMAALRTLQSALGMFDAEADITSPEHAERKAIHLLARAPAIVAGFDRHRKGLPFLRPDPRMSVAQSLLYMMRGEKPSPLVSHAMDVVLILHADHGLNASTFASMVTISTLSDMYSAVTTAIGTLKGPLHGGANMGVLKMLKEIGSIDRVEPYILDKLQRKDKVMGFGHRVYKARDPRATYLKEFTRDLAEETGNTELFELAVKIEEIMEREVGHRGIYPNVDFYSALTFICLGIEMDFFTPIFAMSRIAGWAGHCIEQLSDNKLMRPRAHYTGPHGVPYVPIEQR